MKTEQNKSPPITGNYEKALKQFMGLPHVDDYQLDGTINHLVYRAQHELDLLFEGEWPDDLAFTLAQENKIRSFIRTWGTPEEVRRMNIETPQFRGPKRMAIAWGQE